MSSASEPASATRAARPLKKVVRDSAIAQYHANLDQEKPGAVAELSEKKAMDWRSPYVGIGDEILAADGKICSSAAVLETAFLCGPDKHVMYSVGTRNSWARVRVWGGRAVSYVIASWGAESATTSTHSVPTDSPHTVILTT